MTPRDEGAWHQGVREWGNEHLPVPLFSRLYLPIRFPSLSSPIPFANPFPSVALFLGLLCLLPGEGGIVHLKASRLEQGDGSRPEREDGSLVFSDLPLGQTTVRSCSFILILILRLLIGVGRRVV